MKTASGLISLIAVLCVGATWLASDQQSDMDGQADLEPLPVTTVALQPITSIIRERQFTGLIVAARRSRLAFEHSARLMNVLVDEGATVAKGQVLAVIDRRALETQIAELEARLQQQNAVLDELIKGPRPETIAAMQAERDALTADVELRKATFDRIQNLSDRGATSAQNLDEVRLAWKSAVARREAVSKQLDELLAGTRAEQTAAQKAIVAVLKAQQDRLQIEMDDSELTAPFDGTIVNRTADEGDMLTAQQSVFELLETSRLEAHIGVPFSLIKFLDRKGYHVLSANGMEVTGRIRTVLAQVNAATRTQTVVIEIDDVPADGLVDGQLVRMNFEETQPVQGFRVPLTALAPGSRGLWSAYIVAPDQRDPTRQVINTRLIEVLHTDGIRAVIRGAVFAGERMLVNGIHRVVPGQRVTDHLSLRRNKTCPRCFCATLG